MTRRIEAITAEGFPRVSTMLTEESRAQTRYRKTAGRGLAAEILDVWPGRGRVDVRSSVAIPLPIRVIGHFLCMKPAVLQHGCTPAALDAPRGAAPFEKGKLHREIAHGSGSAIGLAGGRVPLAQATEHRSGAVSRIAEPARAR